MKRKPWTTERIKAFSKVSRQYFTGFKQRFDGSWSRSALSDSASLTPTLWSASELKKTFCLFAAGSGGHTSSIPFPRTRPLCLAAHSAAVSTGVRPHLTFYPDFTHWLHSINKLVSFATHLAGEFSNNIFILFENMNHSHAEYKITSLPLLIKGTAR